MRRISLRAILITFALALVLAPTALAQAKSLYWERYDVDIAVQPNGDLRVVENQVIVFTSGVFREGYAELATRNTEGIDDVTVSENGQPYTFESIISNGDEGAYTTEKTDSGNISVIWAMGPTRNTTRTFELAYTVHGAIRRYPEGNEFQWNAISPGLHDFEIRASTVTLHMPSGAPVTLADYLIPPEFSGVPMDVTQSADNLTVTWTARREILPAEGVQVVVQFPPDTVGGSKPAWQYGYDLRVQWEDRYKPLVDLGLGVLAFLLLTGGPMGLYLLWYWRGRDPKIETVPEYIAAPPNGLPPGIAGTLADERANVQDIIATLIDLARRGYLEIEETDMPSALGLGRDFVLRKKPDADFEELGDYERTLYNAVFGKKDEIRLRDLNQKFYVHLPALQRKLYAEAVAAGYFRSNPESVRGTYSGLGVALIVLAGVGGCVSSGLLSEWTAAIICPFMSLGLLGIALAWLGQHMPVKSRKGAEAAALSRAFKTYLSNLERYADATAVAGQFEQYLPYAIAFGLERSWINRFKRVPSTPPLIWYRPYRPVMVGQTTVMGGAGEAASAPSLQSLSDGVSNSLQSMSDGLNGLLNSAARSFTSTPPSSSSSSRGGRSFSGGGGFRSSGGSGGGARGFR